jgi:hypothetical protein
LTFLAGDPNTLLIAGGADTGSGQISSIGVIRGAGNHITGFSGSGAFFSTAPFVDGGLQYGPGGVLFFTSYPNNTVGEIKPGSTSPDKTVDLNPLGVTPSVGSLGFVPGGFPGAGSFKILSYSPGQPGGNFYDATLSADGSGTYDITSATPKSSGFGGGTEGFGYVPLGSPLFPNPSMLISEFNADRVMAFQLDGNGNPIPASAQTFAFLDNADGAAVDPLTGDILISVFGSDGHIKLIEATPEPGTVILASIGLAGLVGYGWRRHRKCATRQAA